MVEDERFVGIARAPGGTVGRCVCIDSFGRPVGEFSFAWSAEKLRPIVSWFLHEARQNVEVMVGVVADELDDEMVDLLVQSDLDVREVRQWLVNSMWRCLPRKKHTIRLRAYCIAQFLLLVDYTPEVLTRTRR
jgi:hypothetical protein